MVDTTLANKDQSNETKLAAASSKTYKRKSCNTICGQSYFVFESLNIPQS